MYTAAPTDIPESHRMGRPTPARVIRDVLDRIGDRWSAIVLAELSDGPRRYGELRRSISGISQRMLTYSLRGLERDGMISRTVRPTTPPQVEYALTEVGHELHLTLTTVEDWALANHDYIQNSRARYDRRRA